MGIVLAPSPFPTVWWVLPQNFKTLLCCCKYMNTDQRRKKIWRAIPLCIAWTVCLERNIRCFEGKKEHLSFVKFRCLQNLYCWQNGNSDAPTPPVAATIFFGANDAALLGRTSERQHVPLEEYKENLRRIIQHLKKCSPSMLVVLITPPPVDEAGRFEHARSMYGEKAMELPERTNEVTGEYAKQCAELAGELGLPSVNLWSKMQETEGWQKKFLSDGLHLTAEGNAIVYQEVVKAFNEAGFSAQKMPYDVPHHSEIDGQNPEKAFQLQCPAV